MKNLLGKFKQRHEGIARVRYLGLEIGEEVVKTAIFEISEAGSDIVCLGKVVDLENIGEGREDRLAQAVEESLAPLVDKEGSYPRGVVFGVVDSWVSEGKIIDDKLRLLERLCARLGLIPEGFVIIDEALVYYLRIKEGSPPSAILAYIGLGTLRVSLAKLGEIERRSKREIEAEDDLAQVFLRALGEIVEDEVLPSRILLYDAGRDLQDTRESFLSFDWQKAQYRGKRLPFLHFPKIDVMGWQESVRAVVAAGGLEVKQHLKAGLRSDETDVDQGGVEKVKKAEDFGFVIGADVAREERIGHAPVGQKDSDESHMNLGEDKIEADKQIGEIKPEVDHEQELRPDSARGRSGRGRNALSGAKSKLLKLVAVFGKYFGQAGQEAVGLVFRLRLVVLGLMLILALGAVAGFVFYWYVPKARVEIFVKPKILTQELELFVDTGQGELNDKAVDMVKGGFVEVEVSGSRSGEATGTKLVGDRAQGRVMIYNRTSKVKAFEKGEVLVANDDLRFTLDADVLVASQSAQVDEDWNETLTPGTVEVAVTALAIGPEYNLSEGTNFVFVDYSPSDFRAKSVVDFSGGTSREVSVVADDDQEKLFNELLEDLKKRALDKLGEAVSEGDQVFMETADFVEKSKTYDKAVGSEADEFKLDMTLKARSIYCERESLGKQVRRRLESLVSEGYELTDNPEVEIKKLDEREGAIFIVVYARGHLLPKVDKQAIIDALVGKHVLLAAQYLRSISWIQGYKIEIVPELPERIRTMPRSRDKIEIVTKGI